MATITDKDIVQITATSYGGAALARDGHVYVWGKAVVEEIDDLKNETIQVERFAWGNDDGTPALQAEGESAGDSNQKLQNIVRISSNYNRFCVFIGNITFINNSPSNINT